MTLHKKHGYFTFTGTPASSAEATEIPEEVLKSITSLVESLGVPSTAHVSVINATPRYNTMKKNISVSSITPSASSVPLNTNQQKKTGSFWKKIIISLLERTLKTLSK